MTTNQEAPMSRLIRIVRAVVDFIGRAATGYEPAVTAALVAAFFTMLSGVGLYVGDLPTKVDAVLAFVAFVAPLIAGWYARRKVTPLKRLNDGEVLVSDHQAFVLRGDGSGTWPSDHEVAAHLRTRRDQR